MTARCSYDSLPSVGLSPVPSIQAVAQGYQTTLPGPSMYIVEHTNPWDLPPVQRDLIGMDYLPHVRVTEHPIGHPPAGACSTGNYVANPLPFPEGPAINTMPPLSMPSPPSPSSFPSSHDHHIPRACDGVGRRPCLRPSSRGGTNYFSKLTRADRAAAKNTSRRVAFARHTHHITSSLWSDPNDPSSALITTRRPKRHRPPTPSPIPVGHVTNLNRTRASFDCERDMSPGFDADVEFEPPEVERRHHRTHVGAKERLTIVIPGGKSEAYVAMAFERSCSLAHDDDDNDCDARTAHHGVSSSFIPPPSTGRPLLASEEVTSREKKGKTGLKIKIPVPSPLFMLSLRLASSCRVSDESAMAECSSNSDYPESGYSPTGTSSSGSSSSPDSAMMIVSRDHSRDMDPVSLLVRVDDGRASSRTPSHEGRVARRVARRAAVAPY